MTNRLPCVVPGCRCTIKPYRPDDTACICRKHYPLTDRRWRALYRRRRRAEPSEKNARAIERIWYLLVRQAIERSVGLA